jgi:hypothetical protein
MTDAALPQPELVKTEIEKYVTFATLSQNG